LTPFSTLSNETKISEIDLIGELETYDIYGIRNWLALIVVAQGKIIYGFSLRAFG
jgi:hypothetical protein